MNYGQPSAKPEAPEDNLNLENWNAMSDQSFTNRQPIIASGPHASAESPSGANPAEAIEAVTATGSPDYSAMDKRPAGEEISPAPALGQILPTDPTSTQDSPSYNAGYLSNSDIRATGDRLSLATMSAINDAEHELSQTGDLDTFYNQIRDLSDTYRRNSFGSPTGDTAAAPANVTTDATTSTPVNTAAIGTAEGKNR